MFNILLFIQIASIVVLFAESIYVFANMKTDIHKYLLINCIATLINNIGYVLEMTSESETAYLRGVQVSYVGKVWIVYSLFFFLMLVCHIKINRLIRVILAFMHTVIIVLVATCEWNTLYYSSRTYVTTDVLFPVIRTTNGIFHYLYDGLIVVYIVLGVTSLIWCILHTRNKTNKKQLIIIFLAVVSDAMGYLIHLKVEIKGYDTTNLGFAVATLFMGIAIFKFNLLGTLQLVKDYVVDKLPEAIIAVNELGTVDYSNKSANTILEKLGKTEKEAIEIIEKHVEEQTPIEIEGRIFSPEKTILEEEKSAQGQVYVLVDDTEHYTYTQELSKQKEIAEKANASKSRFISVVSHEIRTPMNAVVGMTDLILKEQEKLDEKQTKYLKNIKTSGEALVMIVNDILDQSKIEAGRMELVEAPYEIRPMVEDVKMIIENRLGSKEIKLISDISEEVPQLLVGDCLRIRQILINLMNNAVKFTEKGFIKLSIFNVKQEGKGMLLRFEIADSGQGIKPEDLKKLGEAFVQVDTLKNHEKEGTGLGLSISRDFISMMGGSLKAESEYGKGTTFYFEILQGIVDKEEPQKSTTESEQNDVNNYEDKKILIVDDTEINLMIAEEMLSELKLVIDTATSGERALEKIKETEYDCILMDYMMPRMDGVEATAKIRELSETDKERSEYYRTVPIVALTADDSEETKERFLKAGITGFMEKPITIQNVKYWMNR